jgi:hypothetical protein
MLCLLNSVQESATRLRVGVIHYKPERLTQAQRDAGIIVDATEADLPQPEERRGEAPVLYYDPTTGAFWYEYVSRPLTQEEQIAGLRAELAALKQMALHQYPAWRTGVALKVGDVVVYNHSLYEVIQAHTTQADWTPTAVPALFKVRQPEGATADWVQPTGAHDAYPLGAQVIYQGAVWVSLMAANVWAPGTGALWQRVW